MRDGDEKYFWKGLGLSLPQRIVFISENKKKKKIKVTSG